METFQAKVTPRARKNSVIRSGSQLIVHTTAPAEGGKANRAVVELLASFFRVKKQDVAILRGLASRDKIISVQRPQEP